MRLKERQVKANVFFCSLFGNRDILFWGEFKPLADARSSDFAAAHNVVLIAPSESEGLA